MAKKRSPKVLSLLEELENQQEEVLKNSVEMLKANDCKFGPFDLLAIAALKRTKSLLAGFKILIENHNLVAARALIRMHLDTLMSFYAGWLVDDSHAFATKVLNGERLDKIKDKDGKELRDTYLAKKLNEEYNWVLRVYKITCGYIHLSERHIFSAIKPTQEEGICEIRISSEDEDYQEESYAEALKCFLKITEIFLLYVRGWTATKSGESKV